MHPYLRLIRFDKPIGTLLLWYPTAWALWLATQGQPSLSHILYFFIGTFLMRSAGCVFNDITDRHIDGHVQRTRIRPLVSGEVSLLGAFIILVLLLLLAAIVLSLLPNVCFLYALFALFITFLYPFTKRFFHAPQSILSIAFSMGIPMAFAASHIHNHLIEGLLLLINILWVIAYDTIYALADQLDDAKIGIHSTVLTFRQHTPYVIVLCFALLSLLWLLLAYIYPLNAYFYIGWSAATSLLAYQAFIFLKKKPFHPISFFKAHAYYGLLLWISIVLSVH